MTFYAWKHYVFTRVLLYQWPGLGLKVRFILALLDSLHPLFIKLNLREVVAKEVVNPGSELRPPSAHFTVLGRPRKRRLGRVQGWGDEFIGLDTCVCQRQKLNFNLLKEKIKAEILLEEVTEKLRAGVKPGIQQCHCGSNSFHLSFVFLHVGFILRLSPFLLWFQEALGSCNKKSSSFPNCSP